MRTELTRKCNKCNRRWVLTDDNFYRSSRNKNNFDSACKHCRIDAMQARAKGRQDPTPEDLVHRRNLMNFKVV